jgi:hypothetical protein
MNALYTKDDICFAAQAEAVEMIRHNLREDDRWLVRGLIAIYNCQTAGEQTTQTTKYRNGIGFGAVDSTILTSFAQQAKRTGHLSQKQIDLTRKKMVKYAKQLYALTKPSDN